MSTLYGVPDEEKRPIPHSRAIAFGNHAFNNFHVPGLPVPVADVRSIAVAVDSGGNPVTVTCTFQVIDPNVGTFTTKNVGTGPGDGSQVFVRNGGHVLTAVVIDDAGAGSSGPWAVTASNLDPLPPKTTPFTPDTSDFGGIATAFDAVSLAPAASLTRLPCTLSANPSGLFSFNLPNGIIQWATPGVYLCMAGIFWKGGSPPHAYLAMQGGDLSDGSTGAGPAFQFAQPVQTNLGDADTQSTYAWALHQSFALGGVGLVYAHDAGGPWPIYRAGLSVVKIAGGIFPGFPYPYS